MIAEHERKEESGRKGEKGYLASMMKTLESEKTKNLTCKTISDAELDSDAKESCGSACSSQKKQPKLCELLGSKSPQQFANEFVYRGEVNSVSDSKKKFTKAKAPNFRLDFKENVPRGCVSKMLASPRSERKLESSYRDEVVSPSKYTDLSNKILRELDNRNSSCRFSASEKNKLLLSADEVRRFEEKLRSPDMRSQQKELSSRLHREAEEMELKNRELAQKIEKETFRECTFTPAINREEGDNVDDFMTADQFFEIQMQRAKETEEKRQRLIQEKQEMESSCPFQPEIRKKTKELAKKNLVKLGVDNGDVHARLHIMKSYKDKKPKNLQSNSESEISDLGEISESSHTREDIFSPKINKKSQNMKRGDKIENILYSDALRRKEKKQENEKVKEISEAIKIVSPKVSGKSKQVYIKGFCKEFEEVAASVLSGKSCPTLTYLEMVEILRKMEFLPALDKGPGVGENPRESTILQKVWYVLGGLQNDFILYRNLLVVLLAVMNVQAGEEIPLVREKLSKHSGAPAREIGSSWSQYFQDENLVRLGSFDMYGNLRLSRMDIERIRVSLNCLSVNRVSKKRKIDQELDPTWFSPQISEVSKMLGSSKNERVVAEMRENLLKNFSLSCEDSKEELTRENFTIDQILKFKSEKSKDDQREIKSKLEEKLMGECTFKPKISENPFSAKKSLKEDAENSSEGTLTRLGALSSGKKTHRTIELFQISKHSSKKMDKDPHELEYEKQCDQCTFSPDVSTAHFIPSLPKGAEAKGVSAVVKRIKEGRNERNLNEFIKNKGLSGSAKQKEQFSSTLEEREMKDFSKKRKQKSQKIKPKLDSNLQIKLKSTTSNFGLKSSESKSDYSSIGRNFENIEIKMEEETVNTKKSEDDRTPLLFIDVNIEEGKNARIVIYEGDKSEDVAKKFGQQYSLDEITVRKLKEMLDQQISGVLTKIDEETVSNDESAVDSSGVDE